MSIREMMDRDLKKISNDVMSLMNNQRKYVKRIEQALIVPAQAEIGKAFVDETQYEDWKKFTKKYSSVTRNGTHRKYIVLETLGILIDIERNGIEHAVTSLANVHCPFDEVVHSVVKYSKYGKEYMKEVLRQYSAALDVYPSLKKTLKMDKKISPNRDEYNQKGMQEALEFLEEVYSNLPKKSRFTEVIETEVGFLKEIQQIRNEKKNVVKR